MESHTCVVCKHGFKDILSLDTHRKVSPTCTNQVGRCHYFDSCGYTASSVEDMREHLREDLDVHMEYLTMKMLDLEEEDQPVKTQEKIVDEVNNQTKNRVLPLERAVTDISAVVETLQKKAELCEASSQDAKITLDTVSRNSSHVILLENRIATAERLVDESDLDRADEQIRFHSVDLTDQSRRLNNLDMSMKNAEIGCYEGFYIMKIKDYRERKADAVRGVQKSIFSPPFYSSKYGYKMCCQVYLNGEGSGENTHLSVYFILVKGDFDDLCQFPFQQKVTYSLLCPKDPSLSKHESFIPDPESSSFGRPETEMNIASGCPQFALKSDVESGNFLIDDCIYLRVRVTEESVTAQ